MKVSLREGAPAQAGEGEGENVIVHADFALSQAPSVTRKGSCHLPLGGRLCSRELTHKLQFTQEALNENYIKRH